MQGTAAKRVKAAIVNFFHSVEKKTPINFHDLAVGFRESEPDLIRDWDVERLEVMLRGEVSGMLKPPKPQPFQMFLPGFRGDLGERIPVEEGRVHLGEATLTQLKENLKTLKREAVEKVRLDPKITEREKLIAEMTPYSRAHPGLTVEEYCNLRAAGEAPPRAAKTKTQKTRGASR
jgi:hypothetical protein